MTKSQEKSMEIVKIVNQVEYGYSLKTSVKTWFDVDNVDNCHGHRGLTIPFVEYVVDFVRPMGNKGLLIIGSGHSISSSDLAFLVSHLHRLGLEITSITGIEAGCKFDQLKSIAKNILLTEYDWIIAIGGGSVIDAAKLISIHENGLPLISTHSTIQKIQENVKNASNISVIAIPTCIGSGSEVSSLADVLSEKDAAKIPIISEKLTPAIAILNLELCKTAPDYIQAASIVDTFCHIIDPYLSGGANDSNYEGITAELCHQLVTITNSIINHSADNLTIMRFAWISHLAVSPGIGRTNTDSVIHRIEHGISPSLGLSHGQTLALILPVFLIKIREKFSDSEWARIARLFIKIFDEVATPDQLVQEWLGRMPFGPTKFHLDELQVDNLTNKILTLYGNDGILPGSLNFDSEYLQSLLRECSDMYDLNKRSVKQKNLKGKINEKRIFGQDIAGEWDWLIITPLNNAFHFLCSKLLIEPQLNAWYPSARWATNDKKCLFFQPSPGAISSVDCLHMAQNAGAKFNNIVFIGLAGSLRSDWSLGTQVLPNKIERWESISSCWCRGINSFTPNYSENFRDFMKNNGLVFPQREGICGSITNLAQETPKLLDMWAQLHIDLIDLESASVAAWSEGNRSNFYPMLIVSDYPLEDTPLWNSPVSDRKITASLQNCVQQYITFITSNPNER